MDNTKRVRAFDIAKGLGMLAVILGHMSLPEKMTDFIFSFHMPLFFLINGYFLKREDNVNCLKKKTRFLLVPYMVTGGLVILFSAFFDTLRNVDIIEIKETAKIWILAILYGSGTFTSFLNWNFHIIGAIWFLLAMFWADLIFNFLLEKKWCYIKGMVIALAGYITSKYIWLPMSIQAGMTAIIFIEIGYFVKENNIFMMYKDHWLARVIMMFFWGISIIFGGKLYMVGNYYGNGFLDIIGAVAGTYCIIVFSCFLEKKNSFFSKWLENYGRNSLIVLCFHLIELNTFPWYAINDRLPNGIVIPIIFLLKVLWTVGAIALIRKIPVLKKIYIKK